jgi:L-fuconolactonase
MGRLIDAHIHFWDPNTRNHEWLQALPDLARPFTPSDIDFGTRAPDGVVFVEADCALTESLSEVQWVSSLASGDVPIIGIVARAPLERGAAVGSLLLRLADEPLVVGVRRLLQHEPLALLQDPALVEGARLLADHGFAFDLCVTFDQLRPVTKLVRSCPDTTFVLDHVGKPPVADRLLDPWREDLRMLAMCPNVTCKLSGLATLARAGWSCRDVLPYLRYALGEFEPGRCMFGSDWPVALQNTSYEAWLDTVVEATQDLAPRERDDIFGETATRAYGLPHPTKGELSACSQSIT